MYVRGRLSQFIVGQCAAGCWVSYINWARYPQQPNLVAIHTSVTGNHRQSVVH